jgi:membrane protein implicated in regulation of membrane protease activity
VTERFERADRIQIVEFIVDENGDVHASGSPWGAKA